MRSRADDWYRTLATCIAVSFGTVSAIDIPTRYALAQVAAASAPPAQPAALANPRLDQPQLEQMLAPIALYPDTLLALVLMAATYPLEVVQAERWVSKPENSKLKGPALESALQAQSWDASVKTLVAFPDVLKIVAEKLEWTQQLGDAVLGQQQDVFNAVQVLRARAQKAGKLESGPQQTVTVQVSAPAAPAAPTPTAAPDSGGAPKAPS